MHSKIYYQVVIFFIVLFSFLTIQDSTSAKSDIDQERLALYKKTSAVIPIPWYYLAAMDQYERNIQSETDEEEKVSIKFNKNLWYGAGNVSYNKNPSIISMFNGIGKDGNGDGKADISNEEDILYTAATLLSENGVTKDDIKISLWNYYHRDLTVKTIMNIAKVYNKLQKIDLSERHFPVDTNYNYSYNNNWGDRRGFGGNRIHEGSDIFANYGTPIKSSTYGVVELKGWNVYGGWRIGIRDIHNIYHYYAHLNNYEDNLNIGDVVKPGDSLGTVGSTGYGPPGTSGKFPPHLHYGMYRDNGNVEWSFDPYPYLSKWEKITNE